MNTNRIRNGPLRIARISRTGVVILTLLVNLLPLGPMAQPALAASGSYSITWRAADPAVNRAPYLPTYPKVPPTALACPTPSGGVGSAADPLQDAVSYASPPVSSNLDAVTSLAPKDMALGTIVPFEIEINVNGSTAPENGVIQFTGGWQTVTTSGRAFGYDGSYGVYCAFVDTADPGTTDPGNNAKVDSFSSSLVGTEIQGTIQVSGLNNGDRVIVEIWMVLQSTIPSNVTGNVQSQLISARTVSSHPRTIHTGTQTVPLLRPADFFGAQADVSVTKVDNPDPVLLGGQLTYSIVVTNNSPDTVANGILVSDNLDPNTTYFSSSGAPGGCTHPGGAGGTVTCNVGALSPGQTATINITVTVSDTAPTAGTVQTGPCTVGAPGVDLCNRVSITAITSDPTTSNNSDSEPTNVVAPSIAVTKTADPTSMPEPGDTVDFTVRVDNTGDVPVTLTTLIDDVHGDLDGEGTCAVPQTIAVGGYYECTFSATVSGNAGYSETDTVTATAEDDEDNEVQDTDDATVTIYDVPPSITVDKSADPASLPEPGGTVDFTVRVDNNSVEPVTLTALIDDVHGDLNGQGTCAVPQTIAVGGYYECTFSATVSENAGYSETDTVTATAEDEEGNEVQDTDDATVTVYDVLPSIDVDKTADPTSVPEPGDTVDFTVRVDNTSDETVTLTALIDDVHGDLDGQGTCVVPQTIAVGGYYECTFSGTVSGNAGYSETDTVTATAQDDEDNEVQASGDATVSVTDVPPSIAATKTADPISVPEPGSTVDFTVRVDNNGVEPVTLTALIDDVHGDLNGEGTCAVPQTIAVGGYYECTFSATVNGNAGYSETDTVTATAEDDEDNEVQAADDATVTVYDVPPSIDVDKTADPTSVPEPGDMVDFTVRVYNNSDEPVTLTALIDDVHGDLDGQGTCVVPQTIAVGGYYECTFSATVSGNAGYSETDTVTATAEDEEDNEVQDTDDATVTVYDVLPTIDVDKTADVASVPEPSGSIVFTVRVDNTSDEVVTLTALDDDVYGDITDGSNPLIDSTTCAVPQDIPVGGYYECSFNAILSGNAGDSQTDTVTATAEDDEGNEVQDTDDATVTVYDVPPSITVDKSADPASLPEPGGTVDFTMRVYNNSDEPIALTALIDDVHGDLDGEGTCAVPQTIAVGGHYECTFSAPMSGNAGYSETDTVTATAEDDEDNEVQDTDDATVTVYDVPPSITVDKSADPASLPEPGGTVDFTVRVDNNSDESITLTALIDDVHGDLNGQGTCVVPQTIAVGGYYECTFSATVSGNAGYSETDTVTATAEDDEDNEVQDTDDATVTIEDVPSAIEVIKTANPTSVPEPGGDVIFSFTVNNLSTVDTVTLDSLTDSVFGDLNGQGTCAVPQTIPAGGSYSCSVTVFVGTNTGDLLYNVVTASGTDDDGNPVSDEDDALVTVEDVPSAIEVIKTANPTSMPEPGGDVAYSFTVNNLSTVDEVTLESLTDTVFGDLNGLGDCAVPQTIPVGGSYSCSITVYVSGEAGDVHTNVVTASGTDDDGNPVSDDDDATVFIEEPTAITLASLVAEAGAGSVTLSWETGTEIDNAGFNLYRAKSPDGPYIKLNAALIAAEGDPVSGATYSFLDEDLAPGTYYYELEDVDLNGVTTRHGPVSATVSPGLRRPAYRPTLPGS